LVKRGKQQLFSSFFIYREKPWLKEHEGDFMKVVYFYPSYSRNYYFEGKLINA